MTTMGRQRLDGRSVRPLADLVPRGLIQRKCACGKHTIAGGECDGCRQQHAEAASAGQPLSAAARAWVEPRLGYDFSQVRVHADAKAAEAARMLNAHAFTIGRDIHFGAGEYRPESEPGMKLLAHELAHTVQQSGGPTGLQRYGHEEPVVDDPRLEHEADVAAAKVAAGRVARVTGATQNTMPQRQTKDKKSQAPPAPKIVNPVDPTKPQAKIIERARRAAAVRTQVATFKASGIQGVEVLQEAVTLARLKFDWANPNMDQISEVLSGMGGGLLNVDVKVAGPGDPECGSRSGYVRGHRPPIVLCPAFFSNSTGDEGRIRTMVHEMAHVKGIGKADAAEQYFPIFDCTSGGVFESADAWSNYVHCLSGRTPDKPDEIVGGKGGSKAGKPAPTKSGGRK